MKTSLLVFRFSIILTVLTLFVQCSSDDDAPPPVPTGRSKIFKIYNTDLSDISGTATFIENENNSTTINLALNNMVAGENHPIFIRRNVAAEGGGIGLDLGSIDSNKGTSSITVDKLISGDKIGYEELINFNGYLGIDQSAKNVAVLIAYSDIGPNELTGRSITYGLVPANNSELAGSAKFSERVNGTTLVEIGITSIMPNTELPVDINVTGAGDASTTLIPLTSLKSEKGGTSQTQIRLTIDGTPITYTEILQLDARIEIHPSTDDLDSVIAQGGIGLNADAKVL